MNKFINSYDWHEGCAAGERYAKRAYECGVLETRPIHSNPYTDTFVTLAEYRTSTLSARATFDGVENQYELTIIVRSHTWLLYPEDINQVRNWMRRIVERHPPEKFVCLVDY